MSCLLLASFLLAGCGASGVDDPDGGSDGGVLACEVAADCDDGIACTDDACVDGRCVNTGRDQRCEDDNPCTDDACLAGSGCVNEPNRAPCDDGDACTTRDTCSEGVCAGGGPRDCDDGNPCTDDACEPATGCVHQDNNASCDDGNACSTGDFCSDGLCGGGEPVDCDDGNPCTDDACEPATGCVHQDNTATCDDGDACTTGDVCSGGSCTGGGPRDCDDGNPCTDDACEPDTGCIHQDNTATCDDGDACTTGDVCDQGVCRPGSGVPDCDDGNPCTDDGCDPAAGCIHQDNTAPCDDGNACTSGDVCGGGACSGTAVDCDDGNPCTDAACDPATGCVHQDNTAPCDDGDACTLGDVCSGGACQPGSGTPDCDDDNPCTDDICDPATGCVHADNTLPCDDGDACTQGDTCGGGSCLPGDAVDCDDGNPCTDDDCDPATGCIHADNTLPCDDGDACTMGDTCDQGACYGVPLDADGDGYVDDACSGDDCNDADPGINPGTAEEGPGAAVCTDGIDNDCDGATDLGDGTCGECNTDTDCDDQDVCTGQETCSAHLCQAGTALDCDDGNPCTDDPCDPLQGCTHVDNTAPCEDGDPCTVDDMCADGACQTGVPKDCSDGNPCTDDVCNQANGECGWIDNDDPCSDGDPCTVGDTCAGGSCQAGSQTPDCSDGNPCTDDYCLSGAGCQHDDNTAPCEDGDPCTEPDMCQEGVCVPGPDICGGNVNVLVYMAADNNLDPAGMEDIQEMEAANLDEADWLRVFVLVDRRSSASWSDSRLYEIHNGTSTELGGPNLGITVSGAEELNMGNPDTLRHFILDVQDLAGGNYFLILWNHGDGWRGGEEVPGYKAVGIDESNGDDWLYTAELPAGISGLGIDLVGFDACLEAMTEVGYEIRGHAQVMVASQETEPFDGWEYTGLLSDFMAGGDTSPAAFGVIAADTYMDSYPTSNDVTQSVLDLTRMDDLATACDDMATALSGMASSDWNQLCNEQEEFGGWYDSFVDLYHLAETAKARDAANAAAYDAVMAVLDDLILYARYGTGHPDANGLSIYFECNSTPSSDYDATNIQWAADTGWDEMLDAH